MNTNKLRLSVPELELELGSLCCGEQCLQHQAPIQDSLIMRISLKNYSQFHRSEFEYEDGQSRFTDVTKKSISENWFIMNCE